MPPKIIHGDLPFTHEGKRAEQATLDFLKLLPEGYFVLRECKVSPGINEKAKGSLEVRPDFLVVGPEIGVAVLEVKDWNIQTNRFDFIDQWWVQKIDDRNGNTEKLTNPYSQTDRYRKAVNEILKIPNVGNSLWVSSLVVFPRLIRAEFENRCIGIGKDNPQQGFSFDPHKTLFMDDLHEYLDAPLKLLQRYVTQDLRDYHRQPVIYTEQQVNTTINRLVPGKMHVGGQLNDAGAEGALLTLDKEQQKWAFGLTEKTYLSDVAGSGKTNVLLSRAIHWAEQHITTGGCRILVATYSKPLREELKRIFQAKLGWTSIKPIMSRASIFAM